MALNSDPVLQTLEWEVTNNQLRWREIPKFVEIDAAVVSSKRVTVLKSSNFPAFLNGIVFGPNIVVPRHPFNTSPEVPFFGEKPNLLVSGHLSASRSIFFFGEHGHLYSVKIPTNYPHRGVEQVSKAQLGRDAVATIRRSNHIHAVDSLFGLPDKLILLPDSVSLFDTSTQNAWIIRDLSRLQDGYYYLPAFSIPYVGRKIADKFGEDFSLFWAKHYAEASGRAKATLLTKYGLQLITPNSQNFLIQLDRDLRPTGVVVIRDIGDSVFSSAISWKLGFGKELSMELDAGGTVVAEIRLAWKGYGDFQMDSPEAGVSRSTSELWLRAHERGYLDEIQNALQVQSYVGAQTLDAVERCIVDECNPSVFRLSRRRKWLGQLIVRAESDPMVREALLSYFATRPDSKTRIQKIIEAQDVLPAKRADLLFEFASDWSSPKIEVLNATEIQLLSSVRNSERRYWRADKLVSEGFPLISFNLAIAIAGTLDSSAPRGQRNDQNLFIASYLSGLKNLSVEEELILRGAVDLDSENDGLIETLATQSEF